MKNPNLPFRSVCRSQALFLAISAVLAPSVSIANTPNFEKRIEQTELLADTVFETALGRNDDTKPRIEMLSFVDGISGAAGGRSSISVGAGVGTGIDTSNDFEAVFSSALTDAFSLTNVRDTNRTMKNAPYSAEVTSEKIQLLGDGNQISKRTSSLVYRDSIGRTRQESRNEAGTVRRISISDTANGHRFILDPINKIATKLPNMKDMQEPILRIKSMALERAKEASERAKAIAKTVHLETRNGNEPQRVEVLEIDGNIKINVVRNGVTEITTDEGMRSFSEKFSDGGQVLSAFRDRGFASKATTRDLGSRDFDGVRAEGKMTSYTIPAGEIGNRNPITVSTETWFAPDLGITVYSKQSDPRTGDSIYRVGGIKRSEPALSLFSVPTDYKVKEADLKSLRTNIESTRTK